MKVRKSGNGLCVGIPKAMALLYNIKEGDLVIAIPDENGILFKFPLKKKKEE